MKKSIYEKPLMEFMESKTQTEKAFVFEWKYDAFVCRSCVRGYIVQHNLPLKCSLRGTSVLVRKVETNEKNQET